MVSTGSWLCFLGRSAVRCLIMTEPLSGTLAALRGFCRRWAESEVALGTPSVHSVTPDSCGSFSLVDHEASATSLLSAFEQVSAGVGPGQGLGQFLLASPSCSWS